MADLFVRGYSDNECSDTYGQNYYYEADSESIRNHPLFREELAKKLVNKSAKISKLERKIKKLQDRLKAAKAPAI